MSLALRAPPVARALRGVRRVPARRVRARHCCRAVAPRRAGKSTTACEPEPAAAWGAAALVAGTTVGAGILALPVETAAAGVAPSLTVLGAAWAYSVLTGLLLAEVSLSAGADASGADAPPPSFVSLAARTLGPLGSNAATAGQLFLQYALLVAYTARGGEVLGRFAGASPAAGAAAFTAALGALCALASPAALDACNSALLALLLLAFAVLLADTVPNVNSEALLAADWAAIPASLPVVALAFVYHNVVPLVARACNGHAPSVRTALLRGTALPFAMYAMWEVAVLGSSVNVLQPGADPLASGGFAVDAFSLLAIATSYIGFALSLSDMLLDTPLLGVEQRKSASGVPPAALALALLPPLVCAAYNPSIFLRALEAAGVFGALTLCGILPGAMALVERRTQGTPREEQLAPGGDAAAVAVMLLGGGIVLADLLGGLHT